MTPELARPRGSDYAVLSRQVRQAGLLDRRLRYYAWKISLTAAALVLGWAAFAVIGDSWWQVAVAVFLAAALAQVGFLTHDAGHSQVFRSRRANVVLGFACGNLGTGLSQATPARGPFVVDRRASIIGSARLSLTSLFSAPRVDRLRGGQSPTGPARPPTEPSR